MEKTKTSIKGLDEMLQGGLPKKKHIALSGGPGCGKTSIAFEFLYRGAQRDEKGLFITLQESEEEIKENMGSTFSKFTDLEDLFKNKRLQVAKPDKLTFEAIAELVETQITENEIKRVVIDSATMLKYSVESDSEYRQTLLEFLALLRNMDCTVIMTVEASRAGKENMQFDIEHFVADGVISLYNMEQGTQRILALEIFKMRGTDHSREIVPFKVTSEGIKIFVGEKLF